MAIEKKRPSRRQSVISFGIIIILAGIAAVLIKMQFGYKTDLQPAFTPAGFKLFGRPEIYTEENLYNKIDGKAPLYTESGFLKLTTQRYISTENDELTFETYIFDMANVKNAFNVYGQQKRSDAKSAAGLKFAYTTANAAYLVYGRYYCEIVGSSDKPELTKAISETLNNLSDSLNQPGKVQIDELNLFPAENLVAGSEKLYLSGAFGCTGLNNIFTAQYNIKGETFTAFISQLSSEQSALKMFNLYKSFLVNNDGEIVRSDNPNVIVIDIFGLNELIAVKDNFVFGIHEFESSDAVNELFRLILNNLKDTNK